MRSNKGQLGGIAYILVVIVITAFILSWFAPVISDSADTAENSVSDDSIVGNFVLIAFQPLMWVFYFILTIIVLAAVLFRGES